MLFAFTGALWSTLRDDAQYFKHVDEVMASPAQWEGKALEAAVAAWEASPEVQKDPGKNRQILA